MTLTAEYVGQVWAQTINPTVIKVSQIIRDSGRPISPRTVMRMRDSGWREPPRTGKRGRPRMSERGKTAGNKILVLTSTFTKDPLVDLTKELTFTRDLRAYMSGEDVAFEKICDEMNKVFGRTITMMLKQLYESNLMLDHPQNFVRVFEALTNGVLAVNDPKVKASIEANMKLINGSGDAAVGGGDDLSSFLTINGG